MLSLRVSTLTVHCRPGYVLTRSSPMRLAIQNSSASAFCSWLSPGWTTLKSCMLFSDFSIRLPFGSFNLKLCVLVLRVDRMDKTVGAVGNRLRYCGSSGKTWAGYGLRVYLPELSHVRPHDRNHVLVHYGISGSTEFSFSGSTLFRIRSPSSSAKVWHKASASSGEANPRFFMSFLRSRRTRS